MQLTQRGRISFPGSILLEGVHTAVLPRLDDGPGDHGGGRHMHMVRHFQVTQDDGPPTHGAMRPDAGTARHAYTARHGRVSANADVVADLDEIVQLDALLDHGVFQGTAVHAGVRANLHVIANTHGAQLLDLLPSALMGRETESIGTDHDPGVQDASLTHGATPAQNDARPQTAVGTQHRLILHHGVGPHPCTSTHPGTRPDHSQRVHPGRRMHLGGPIHHRRRVLPGCCLDGCVFACPPLSQSGVRQIRVGTDDRAGQVCHLGSKPRADNHASCACGLQLRRVTGIGEKRHRGVVSTLEGPDALDDQVGSTDHLPAEQRAQVRNPNLRHVDLTFTWPVHSGRGSPCQ
jgi:hypothetical protein